MPVAKVMDIKSRPPGCTGQAADAVSAYTQVKMEDAPKLLKIPQMEDAPDIWIRPPRHKGPKSRSSMEDPVIPLERNIFHPLTGLLWERQFEKILLQHGWEKVPYWKCSFVHCEKGLFLSVCVDDIKLAGKKQNIDPMWIVRNKEVDLGEPTSFLDHVYLGCTQRQCEMSKDIMDNYRTMFESRIFAGATAKPPYSENLSISSWSYDRVPRFCGYKRLFWDTTFLEGGAYFGIQKTFYDTKWPKSWSSMEDPVVPLERKLYGHPLAGLLWERQFEKVLQNTFGEKFQNGNAYSLTEKGTILVCVRGRKKLTGKKQTQTQCGKYF